MNPDPSLAIRFLNSGTAPGGGGHDAFSAPEEAWRWLQAAGIPTGTTHPTPPDLRRLLDESLRLRAALGHLVEARANSGAPASPAPLLELNRILEARPRHLVRVRKAPEGYILEERSEEAGVPGLLAPVAEAGAALLCGTPRSWLRRCAAPGCGHWFVDTSKNQRRRWCSMEICGNRAKVAHHRRRARARQG